MKIKINKLIKTMLIVLIACCSVSCKKTNVKTVELDNSYALSLFSDTIQLDRLLVQLDSTVSQWINVDPNGDMFAYYSDSVINAVEGKDILGGMSNLTFDENYEFELPLFELPSEPGIAELVPLEFKDLLAVPFAFEGYEITSVRLKSGNLKLMLTSNLEIDSIQLTTDDIKLNDGTDLTINLDMDSNEEINIDLTNCLIRPNNKEVTFTAIIYVLISENQFSGGGMYNLRVKGDVTDINFESFSGALTNTQFDFIGGKDIVLGLSNLSGDFNLVTPEINIKYTNSFGFEADGFIDSLYLKDVNGNNTSLIKDWRPLEISLETTGGEYEDVQELSEDVVDELNILGNYNEIRFHGNIILGCDDLSDEMIAYDSHIDVVADIKMPMKFNMNNLRYIDTIDFNMSTSEDADFIEEDDHFDELEFKFAIENKLPIQIAPQLYMIKNDDVVDSVLVGNNVINACYEGQPIQDVIVVSIADEKIDKFMSSDKLLLDLRFSTEGNVVIMNVNDYINMKIGLKTKTTEISF